VVRGQLPAALLLRLLEFDVFAFEASGDKFNDFLLSTAMAACRLTREH
jgi:hypothetical protein